MVRAINKAAVLGAGVMGSGIAALLAGVGVEVKLLDVVPKSLDENEMKKQENAISSSVNKGI